MSASQRAKVLTAWCEGARGPGWANTPVWVITVDGDGTLRRDCLQPEQQSPGLLSAYRLLEQAHKLCMAEVEASYAKKRKPK